MSLSEDDDIVIMTGNFTRDNTTSDFLPFSACHRYTIVLQKSLANAKVSARQQCVAYIKEDP